MSLQHAESCNHLVIIVFNIVDLTALGHYGVHGSHSQSHYCTLQDNGHKRAKLHLRPLIRYFITLLRLMGKMGFS